MYDFPPDKSMASTCYGACAALWPPLTTTAKPIAGHGVRASLLGTTKRKDGKLEVTYNHSPALLLRQRSEARPDDRSGRQPVRRPVVGPLGRRQGDPPWLARDAHGPDSCGEVARYLGALSLVVVGVIHAQQYYYDYFSVVPTIGTLFVLSFVGSGVVGRRPDRAGQATRSQRRRSDPRPGRTVRNRHRGRVACQPPISEYYAALRVHGVRLPARDRAHADLRQSYDRPARTVPRRLVRSRHAHGGASACAFATPPRTRHARALPLRPAAIAVGRQGQLLLVHTCSEGARKMKRLALTALVLMLALPTGVALAQSTAHRQGATARARDRSSPASRCSTGTRNCSRS